MSEVSHDIESEFLANAFVSCSLRPEDRPFIEFVERILTVHQLQPFGTVGRYDAAPENPALTMQANIHLSDIVVLVATSRYLQQDVHSGNQTAGLPEMLHVESGIAYAFNKPIVVFVQKGTSVGSFIPNITQYITLDGSLVDYEEKQSLIYNLLNNAFQISFKQKNEEQSRGFQKLFVNGMALWGGYKILESISDDNKRRKRKY